MLKLLRPSWSLLSLRPHTLRHLKSLLQPPHWPVTVTCSPCGLMPEAIPTIHKALRISHRCVIRSYITLFSCLKSVTSFPLSLRKNPILTLTYVTSSEPSNPPGWLGPSCHSSFILNVTFSSKAILSPSMASQFIFNTALVASVFVFAHFHIHSYLWPASQPEPQFP